MSKFFRIKENIAKILLAGIVAGSLCTGAQPVRAAVINDISLSSDYARSSILALAEKNIISGDQYGNFRPYGVITRAEMVKVLVNALAIDTGVLPEKPTFKDVPKTHWAYKYIEAAARQGIIKGLPDGTFGIAKKLSRQEMATMFVRSAGLSDSVIKKTQLLENLNQLEDSRKVLEWAQGSVDFALSVGLMNGVGRDSFLPEGNAERQQVAVVADRFLKNSDDILKLADSVSSMAQEQTRIIVNGEVINTGIKPVVENRQVLAPARLFEEIGARVTLNSSTQEVLIEKSGTIAANIRFKAGSTIAYVNYFGYSNPFINSGGLEAYKRTLAAAPRLSGSDILVPVELTAQTLGVQVQYSESAGTVTITDNAMSMYPHLLSAINGNLNYKGRFGLKMDVMINENNSNQYLSEAFDMTGAINGQDMDARIKVASIYPGYAYSELAYDFINAGGKAYARFSAASPWIETTLEEMQEVGLIDMNFNQVTHNNPLLLSKYGSLDIARAGTAVIESSIVTKYSTRLNDEMIQALADYGKIFQAGEYDGTTDIRLLFNKGREFNIDFYVNGQNQLVKEVYRFNGSTVDDRRLDLETNMVIDMIYRSIGENITISAPQIVETPAAQ